MEPFDIEELKAFVVMADEGYFSESAEALGISQPAVSQRIARLESSLGFHLFTRTGQGAVLTPYGQKLLQAARRCVESHRQLLRQMDDRRHSAGGRVRIWIEPSLANEVLLRSLAEPPEGSADLEISTARRMPNWAEQLRNLEIDLVVCGSFLQPPARPGLEWTELFREPGLTAVWSREHFEIPPETFCLARALSTTLVLPSSGWLRGVRPFIDDWCFRVYQKAAVDVMEVHGCQEAAKACRMGRRIAILPGSLMSSMTVSQDSSLLNRGLFQEVLPNAYHVGLFSRESEASSVVIEASLRLKDAYLRWFLIATGGLFPLV